MLYITIVKDAVYESTEKSSVITALVMGKEAELIRAAKTGDTKTLERHLQGSKRGSMIGK